MGKIIIISFAFMAFAFYEISGGEDFVSVAEEKRVALAAETEAVRIAEAKAKAEREAEQVAARTQTDQEAVVVPASQVVRASLILEETAPADTATGTATQTGSETGTSDAQAITAALSETLDETKAEDVTQQIVAAEPEPEAAPQDIREVTAARVNMRNGPGQTFNVLAKLTAGQQVEILQDPGDGWVKLRVVDNGRVGWMADFLLTASNN